MEQWDVDEAAAEAAARQALMPQKPESASKSEEWNAMYDAGKVKKVKKNKSDLFENLENPFQKVAQLSSTQSMHTTILLLGEAVAKTFARVPDL